MWIGISGVIIGLVGLFFAGKTFISEKKASKEKIRRSLIATGISEYRQNGQARTYLLQEYKHYDDQGWSEKEFEEIYETIAMRTKGRKFKAELFAKK